MPLKPEIIVRDNSIQLAQAGADIFSRIARDSVTQRGRFIVALSGGSTPRTMHRFLAEKSFCTVIPWDETNIFWVDERCVPFIDQASNYGAARQDLLDHVSIPPNHIHPMPVDMDPEDGAVEYQRAIIDFFQPKENEFPVFDLIFLGIGKDGHTASLFPGQKVLDEKERFIVAVKGGDPHVSRLTMTLPVLNSARKIVFLVAGKEKAKVVKAVLEKKRIHLPAYNIRPINGKLTWLLDREAASLLSGDAINDRS